MNQNRSTDFKIDQKISSNIILNHSTPFESRFIILMLNLFSIALSAEIRKLNLFVNAS